MSSADLSTILDECITQLQKGASLEQVLARYPQQADELKGLLETAGSLNTSRAKVQISQNAQSRSRMAFINAAYQPVKNQGLFHAFHLRFATAFVIILILLGFGVLGTTLVSAHSLPGDTFYPVKLALEQVQLNFANGSAQRLELQQNFDERRAVEVTELKQAGRSSPVSFTGELIRSGGQWQVAGITLDLTSQQEIDAAGLMNEIVEVSGDLEGMTVHVSDFHLYVLTFNGIVQEIRANSWLVDGVEFTIDSNTDIAGAVKVGSSVLITAQRKNNGLILALTVDVTGASLVRETVNSVGEVQEETQTLTPSGENDSHPGSGDQNNPSGGEQTPNSTLQDTSTPRNEGGDNKSTATGVINPTSDPTSPSQHEGDGEGPTRTRSTPQNPTATPTLSPTPTLTPTNRDSNNDPGDHNRTSRTPTPTPTQQDP